jgi:predicted hotdog family 3-hydroxylacyl-ACP dehydratase
MKSRSTPVSPSARRPVQPTDGSLPAWVGIELMAQSVAAFAGCHARQRGDAVALGFLLGSRKFECNVESFPAGTELTIHGLRSLEDDNGMGVFECHINAPGIHATARLNVYRPPQPTNIFPSPKARHKEHNHD